MGSKFYKFTMGSFVVLILLSTLLFTYREDYYNNYRNLIFVSNNPDEKSSKSIEEFQNAPLFGESNQKLLCSRIIMKKIIQCQLTVLETTKNFWQDLTPTIMECTLILRRLLKIKLIFNDDDVKYFILPTDYNGEEKNSTECFSLTIGKFLIGPKSLSIASLQ